MNYYTDENNVDLFRTCYGMLEKFTEKSWHVISIRVSEWEIEERGLRLLPDEEGRRLLEHNLLTSLDYRRLKELAGFLHRYKVEWVPGRRRDNGAYILPFPNYDDRVFEALDVLGFSTDYEYAPQPKCVSKLSVLQIRDYLTQISVGERFCDGVIAEVADNGNGTLYKLLLRLLELYRQHVFVREEE